MEGRKREHPWAGYGKADLSTFEDALECQILRAEFVEALKQEQLVNEDRLRRARENGSRWDVLRARVRVWSTRRRIHALL